VVAFVGVYGRCENGNMVAGREPNGVLKAEYSAVKPVATYYVATVIQLSWLTGRTPSCIYIVVGFHGPLLKSHDLEDNFPLRTH
jgi:hypothetical protein